MPFLSVHLFSQIHFCLILFSLPRLDFTCAVHIHRLRSRTKYGAPWFGQVPLHTTSRHGQSSLPVWDPRCRVYPSRRSSDNAHHADTLVESRKVLSVEIFSRIFHPFELHIVMLDLTAGNLHIDSILYRTFLFGFTRIAFFRTFVTIFVDFVLFTVDICSTFFDITFSCV